VSDAPHAALDDLFAIAGLLDIMSGGKVAASFWRRKWQTVDAVILTDHYSVNEDCLVPSDRLGYCLTVDGEDNERRFLESTGLDETSVVTILKDSRHRLRHGHDWRVCIVLNRNALVAQVASLDADLATLMRLVLWHELGHVVFNPNITDWSIPLLLLQKQGNYKRAKALQFLVEGSAEWFALHAETWDDSLRTALFNLDATDEVDEYSYVSILEALPPVPLMRILLPFAWGCLSQALWALPVSEDGRHKLRPEDFGGLPDKGMGHDTYHGLVTWVAQGCGIRIGLAGLITLQRFFPEYVSQTVIDLELLEATQIIPLDKAEANKKQFGGERYKFHFAPRFYPEKIADKSEICTFESDFDVFLQPRLRQPVGQDEMVFIMQENLGNLTILAVDRTVSGKNAAWFFMVQVDSRGQAQESVWSRCANWATPVLRRASWYGSLP
jgi:hypothetical protein